MKIITKEFEVYTYKELIGKTRERVINNLINSYLNLNYEDMPPIIQVGIDKALKMKTPWFTSNYIYDNYKKELEEEAQELNLYLKDGSIFN